MRRTVILIMTLLLVCTIALWAEDGTTLYIEGLESLVEEEPGTAETSFSTLLDRYPYSPYAGRAYDYLYEIQHTVDNSGIVPFYLRNLATTTYTSMMLPTLLDIDDSALSMGLTGLAGVGLGLAGSAWMAADYPITAGLSWWITTAQLISFGNYLYLNGIIDLDTLVGPDAANDIFLSGQLVTLNGSLFGSYFGLRDRATSQGKGAFILQSYLWANAYYWLGVLIADSYDLQTNSSWGIAVTDLATIGSGFLWDSIRWTPMRSGLVTVGGLGGALIGFFSTMILDEFLTLDERDIAAIAMGTTAAGQAAATWLTRNLPEEELFTTAFADDLILYPRVTPGGEFGIGLMCSL